MFIYLLFFLIFPQIHAKFFLNSQTSSIIVLRHRRLTTDNDYYRIRCPYHLKHLTITLLNYSNADCFSLYSKSVEKFCPNSQSPCQFYGKSIPLNCPPQPSYSNLVDITYQCSSTNSTFLIEENSSTTPSTEPITLHSLTYSFGNEESIGIFFLGLILVFLLWLTICCLWIFRCHHLSSTGRDDLRIFSEEKSMIVGNLSHQTTTGGIDNLCLHINPFETKCPSSST